MALQALRRSWSHEEASTFMNKRSFLLTRRRFESGDEVAKEMGLDPKVLKATFDKYNEGARTKQDPFGKKVRLFVFLRGVI